MSGPPPPPPPPHGESPKTTAGGKSGLPPGKYDIFIIPEHSAGSGFLYLPSMRPNTNSFVAGFACALAMVVIGQSMAPAFQAWWANFQGMGNAGMMLLVIAVGLGAWSIGRQQQDGSASSSSGASFNGGSMPGGGGFSSAGSSPNSNHHSSPPPPNSGPAPAPGRERPGTSWQGPPPQPGTSHSHAPPETPTPETPKNSWAKAREEVRRKEEERKAKEAEQKRRDEAAQRLKELREKEARERAKREQEKQRRESELKEKEAKEREVKEKEDKEREAKLRSEKAQSEARQKELRERLAREREERRKKQDDEKKRKEEEDVQSRKGTSYAYSAVGEKTNPWPNGKPSGASPSPSPTKKPPPPTARTVGDEEAYSYRPYDQPKRPAHRKSNSEMSQSSWAPSQSTTATTPPASVRGPYSTKDPDKIVIKAVYSFMNQFAKTPASQLISGTGSVTDGLILRITTEGLFIDDDVRGVAQREWDVKAWTLKLVEVWCPSQFLASATAATVSPGAKNPQSPGSSNLNTSFFARKIGSQRLRAAERGAPKAVTGDDADTCLTELLRLCNGSCRLGSCASMFANLDDDSASSTSCRTNGTSATSQTGDYKAKGLHLLRATVRDQEGKRYLFVISEEEGWKVAIGLQRLRKGTQVRALGYAGLSGLETKSTLEMLGWG